jgi:hypothetical protein
LITSNTSHASDACFCLFCCLFCRGRICEACTNLLRERGVPHAQKLILEVQPPMLIIDVRGFVLKYSQQNAPQHSFEITQNEHVLLRFSVEGGRIHDQRCGFFVDEICIFYDVNAPKFNNIRWKCNGWKNTYSLVQALEAVGEFSDDSRSANINYFSQWLCMLQHTGVCDNDYMDRLRVLMNSDPVLLAGLC